MLSNKHILPTEDRGHVDKESKRDRADQIHIYLQLTDRFSKIDSHLYWLFVTLETAEMTALEK